MALTARVDAAPLDVSRLVTSPDAPRLEVISPLDGRVLGTLPTATRDDVRLAVQAAGRAQRGWSETPLADRCAVLDRFHDLVVTHQEELLDLVQQESGKTRLNAFEEVVSLLNVARHYARAAASYLAPRRSRGLVPVLTTVETRRHPWGVVGVITPWNFPLTLAIGDTLPALVAGNAVVLRPDPQATFSALAAVAFLDAAGLPPGVLQVVAGDGPTAGQAVVDTVDFVAYTGSTQTGRWVGQAAARRLVGASLELGGKNSLYVRDDADLDRAVDGALRACFNSAGQVCVSAERLLVHEGIAEAFLLRFIPAVRSLRLGVSLAYGADVGSLAGEAQLRRVSEHVADAVAKGAEVLVGGRARPEIGPFVYEPTVLAGVTAAMTCRDSETFGPVVALYVVADDDEAVRLANDTDYGLHATIYSRDERAAARVGARLASGSVSVNETYVTSWGAIAAPMGGMKASGTGRRHGAEGLLRFTQSQAITIQRGVGFGVPSGLSQERFAALLTQGFVLLKRVGLR